MPRKRVTVHLFDPSEDAELLAQARDLGLLGEVAFFEGVAAAGEALVPNAPMAIEDWAPDNVFIPASKTTRGGRARLTGIQRGICRMIQSFGTESVVLLKGPRIGASTLSAILIAYYSCHEQCDALLYERSVLTAQRFSKDKLMPILRASTGLKRLLRPDGKTGEQDTWDNRELLNGASIKHVSIHNDDSFKGIRGRFIVGEEAGDDDWQAAPGSKEGSKIDRLRRRGQEFPDGKVYLSGTPTLKGKCLISAEYEASDKCVYMMDCPHCGTRQAFVPDVRRCMDPTLRYGPGIRYTLDARNRCTDAWYECENGDCTSPLGRIDESYKSSMLEGGDFEPTVDTGEPGRRGAYVWLAHSEDEKAGWRSIGQDHDRQFVRGTEEERKEFVNMVLASPFEVSPLGTLDVDKLMENQISLEPGVDMPDDAVFLVAAIDNQRGTADDPKNPPRGEMTIFAACRNSRWFIVDHKVISHLEWTTKHGEEKRIGIDPFGVEYIDAVYEALDREYVTADGRKLKVRKTFVDCGWQTDLAWKFCVMPSSKERGIVPILGDKTERANRKVTLLPQNGALKKAKKSGRSYVYIGTWDAKEECARRLTIPAEAPGSITYAPHLEASYFEGLIAEALVELKNGIRTWQSVGSNTGESWDCLQYCYAAKELIIMRNKRLRAEVDSVDPELAQAALQAKLDASKPPAIVEVDAEEPPLQGSGDEQETPAEDAVPPSGLRMRVVERKTRRPETTPEVSSRIERIRRRQSRSGVGW